MRTIKFRGWLKKERVMLKAVYVIDQTGNGGGGYAHENGCKGYAEVNEQYEFSYADVELMQFTGLLDCKGQEIFEGDLIASGTKAVSPWEIVWREDWAKFVMFGRQIGVRTNVKNGKTKIRRGRCIYMSIQKVPRLEKIGNRFENADLLTK